MAYTVQMTTKYNPRLTQFIDSELDSRNLRVSSRLSQEQRLQKMIELVCTHKGVKADAMDIEILSSLIQLAFAMHEKPEQWTTHAIETLPTEPIAKEEPVKFNVTFGHSMTRRSQTKK
jgi:hypothetical protein